MTINNAVEAASHSVMQMDHIISSLSTVYASTWDILVNYTLKKVVRNKWKLVKGW